MAVEVSVKEELFNPFIYLAQLKLKEKINTV